MQPSPSRAPRLSAVLLAGVMLLVPIGLLVGARSLLPDWSRWNRLGPAPAASDRAEPIADQVAPALRGRVLDPDGNPVVGAAVHLVSVTVPPQLVDATKSGRDGVFAFIRLDPATVRLVADHEPEGVVTSPDVVVGGDAPSDVLLVLSAAEAIRGLVVDGEGNPIADAAVTAVGLPWEGPAATSDGEGAFRLATVPHDVTSLVATARGYRPASASLAARAQSKEPTPHVVRLQLALGPAIDGVVVDTDGQPAQARVVACEGERYAAETTSGGDGSFELPPTTTGCTATAFRDDSAASEPVTLAPGGHVTLRLQAGGSIEGFVVDERGSAVASFAVGVEAFSATRGKSGSGGGHARTFDDGRGSFKVEGLTPGTYVLTASAPNKPPARSEPIAVTSGVPTRGVRIVLSVGGVVVGHVYDEQHAPVEGVDLGFDQVSSVAVSKARATTDDRGAYRLEGAPAGPFTLRASKAGFRMQMTAGLHVDPGATLTQDLTLRGSDGGTGLELGGIGAAVDRRGGAILFARIFPGDPADRAGLRSGDHVLRIDGEPTEGMSLADVLQRLRGTPGTSVGLSVRRGEGADAELVDAVVVRAVIVH